MQAKEKVIPESGCGVGVTSIFLPGQNGNGFLSCLRFCPVIWMGFAWASAWGHLHGVLPRHLDGLLPRHLSGWGFAQAHEWGHLDGVLILPVGTSFDKICPHMDGASSPCRGKHPSRCPLRCLGKTLSGPYPGGVRRVRSNPPFHQDSN